MFTITVASFKTQFDRGQFTYSAVLPDARDKDITAAIAEANAVFNQDLYPTEPDSGTLPLLYLTAHFLQLDLEASESGGQSKYNQNSRGADGLSESVSIPEWMNEGEFGLYSTTYYGQKWLALSKPYMDGAVYSVSGGTHF